MDRRNNWSRDWASTLEDLVRNRLARPAIGNGQSKYNKLKLFQCFWKHLSGFEVVNPAMKFVVLWQQWEGLPKCTHPSYPLGLVVETPEGNLASRNCAPQTRQGLSKIYSVIGWRFDWVPNNSHFYSTWTILIHASFIINHHHLNIHPVDHLQLLALFLHIFVWMNPLSSVPWQNWLHCSTLPLVWYALLLNTRVVSAVLKRAVGGGIGRYPIFWWAS